MKSYYRSLIMNTVKPGHKGVISNWKDGQNNVTVVSVSFQEQLLWFRLVQRLVRAVAVRPGPWREV